MGNGGCATIAHLLFLALRCRHPERSEGPRSEGPREGSPTHPLPRSFRWTCVDLSALSGNYGDSFLPEG